MARMTPKPLIGPVPSQIRMTAVMMRGDVRVENGGQRAAVARFERIEQIFAAAPSPRACARKSGCSRPPPCPMVSTSAATPGSVSVAPRLACTPKITRDVEHQRDDGQEPGERINPAHENHHQQRAQQPRLDGAVARLLRRGSGRLRSSRRAARPCRAGY